MEEDCNVLGKSTSLMALILGFFLIPNIPGPPVTKRQALSSVLRPGLSAVKIASEIIKRQSEAGAILGVNDDGSANISEKMELIRVEEIIKGIVLDGKVTITLLPGQVTTPTGAGAPATIVTTGTGFGIMT